MTHPRRLPWVVLPLALAAAGCKKHHGAGTKPAASATASASAAGHSLGKAQRLFCRAIAVKGSVKVVGGKVVKDKAPIDGSRWLELGKGAELSVRHSLSAREFQLRGPARAVVCPSGEEQILLASGEVITTNGPGARPGAEALIATPLGTVGYGDARLVAKLDNRQLQVSVQSGDAWVTPAPGSTRKGPERVDPKQKASLELSGELDTRKLVKLCHKAAEEAARRARAVMAGPRKAKDAGSLGERAAAHVRARKGARAACATAEAAAGRTSDPAELKRLWGELEQSEQLWRAIPHH